MPGPLVNVPVQLDDLILDIKLEPTATANRGLVSAGTAPFDGATAGFYVGSPQGTYLAFNAAVGYTGAWADYQINGTSKYTIRNKGSVRSTTFFMGDASELTNADVPNFTAIVGAPGYFVFASKAGAGAGTYWYSDANAFFMAPGGIFAFCTNISNGANYAQMQLGDGAILMRDASNLGATLRGIGNRTVNLWGTAANTGLGVANRILWQSGQAAPVAGTRILSIGWSASGNPPTFTETACFIQSGAFQLTGLTTTAPAERPQLQLVPTWVDPADATRKARVTVSIFDTAAREAFRMEADGANPRIGFLGAAAVARPAITGSRAGNAALASLLTQLATLGLVTDTTTA